MEMTSFLAGIAVGYQLAKRNVDIDVSLQVLGKKLVSVKVGQTTCTIDPKKLPSLINPEDIWENSPYYSGWRSELDQYFLERGLQG